MKKPAFEISTEPTKEVVVDSLTRDIDVEACIFDLIDNSIDAARAHFGSNIKKARIKIWCGKKKIELTDNCGGIDKEELEKEALRFGKKSQKEGGIGVFGVGLNRAIFRLGLKFRIVTGKGNEFYRASIDAENYREDQGSWLIPAYLSKKLPRGSSTIITISKLYPTTQEVTGKQTVRKSLTEKLSQRYALFILQGLRIEINSQNVEPKFTYFRSDSAFEKRDYEIKLDGDTSIRVEAGEHVRHRFKEDIDYKSSENNSLSEEYGWNIYCNERLVAGGQKRIGWPNSFHSQYYGFVGHIYFTSKNASELPWTTSKSSVDLNNENMQEAEEWMKKTTQEWIDFTNKRKTNVRVKSPKSKTNKVARRRLKVARKPTPEAEVETLIPTDYAVSDKCNDKVKDMVSEGKKLDYKPYTYGSVILLRSLFEQAACDYLRRHKMFGRAKNAILTEYQARRSVTLNKAARDSYIPSVVYLLSYFLKNLDVFLDEEGATLKGSLENLEKYRKLLNSAVHSDTTHITPNQRDEVRVAVLPILKHFLEN